LPTAASEAALDRLGKGETMNRFRSSALIVAGVVAAFSAGVRADDSADSGRRIFAQRCQTCHGITGPADTATGPDLRHLYGRKAGSGDSGVHSRAAVEADTVWTRSALRRYLSAPGREMPGTLMPVQVTDARELDDLLNFLEILR
jgi:cytochrome c